ncbi:helix-turn-helix domain-containing protein [Streptomyces sp. NPDC006208]|uniref:helix-turn-helix domain-containing protein n=1 Tax=Streptomyces sp. NPDC006208 TaxID=3156734 RepID=UPI0033A7A014
MRKRTRSAWVALGSTARLTGTQVAQHLLISRTKIILRENGRRSIGPRDARDLGGVYGVTDQQVVAS